MSSSWTKLIVIPTGISTAAVVGIILVVIALGSGESKVSAGKPGPLTTQAVETKRDYQTQRKRKS